MDADDLSTPDRLVAGLLAAAADYDFEGCDRVFAVAVERLEPLELVRDVTSPALREAGNRWHRGEWSVVQEHLLSGVVHRQLSAALHLHLRRSDGPSILFTTLSGERHELGGLMGAFLAASHGFRSIYLGPDLPPREICLFCSRKPVAALALSLVTQPDVNDARGQLAELRHGVPAETGIWVAGQATTLLARELLPVGVVAIPDLPAFLTRLTELKARFP
ncbi:MAG: B12-binding domain-containing protein [Gammaproteobacteria bacterium]